jgi:TolB-like protein/DNA-binding winged helix-turn-helix (wHTH) protein/Tfp pilus assembly protein PilF
MDMQSRESETYRVGDLWIDLSQRIVCRNGVQVPLPRLSFDLLVALARAHPRLLTIPELMHRVWSPAVVNPETVAQRIKLLRHSLGDDPRNPRYIMGVRGRGYRAGTRVEPAPAIVAPDVPAAALPGVAISSVMPFPNALPAARPRRTWLKFAGLGLAFATIVVIGYLRVQERPSSSIINDRSVAVLPFADMSENHDQAYLADGLTNELINRLTTIAGLQVASNTSSLYFKGKPAALRDIGNSLHVANLLEGSVRTSGDGLRITAELVRIDTGHQIWTGRFDRASADLFKVQDEIAGAVTQVLRLTLVDHYTPMAAPTGNIEAYTLYLRALSHITNNGADDYDAAIEHLHAALTLNSQFADAWAALSMAVLFKGNTRGKPTAAACEEARTAANRALTLNQLLEEGHRAAGLAIQYCDGDLSGAETEFSRAIQVAPERADALRSYAWLLVDTGRFDQARLLAQRALELDPLNSWNYVALGDSWWRLGRVSEAAKAYQRAVELNPTTTSLHALYANVLLSAHRPVEAVAEAELEPDPQYRQLTLPIALDAAGRKDEADHAAAEYEVQHAKDDPGEIAVFYACRNDVDHAIVWLRKFSETYSGEFATLPNRIACLRNIESDSRYVALLPRAKQDTSGRPTTVAIRSFRHVDRFSHSSASRANQLARRD